MEVRERIVSVLSGRMPDKIPWLIYSNHLPRGSFERRMREMGLGLDERCSIYRIFMPNVRIESRTIGDYVYTTYRTPVGELHSKTRIGMRFQFPGGSWTVEYPVKNTDDVKALRFMIEDTVYEPDYENYVRIKEELGEDGIVTVWADYTPLMKIIVRYMGFRTFALMYRKNRGVIEDLINILDESFSKMYRIIADSPAEIVRIGDNTDSLLVSPSLFEKYCLPYYDKYAETLHEKGKIVISHMDGRLKALKNLIAKTRLDAIEAFTPPPGGDLPPREAKEAWSDKAVWMNFPEEVFLRTPEEIERYTTALLEEIAPGESFIISVTEDIHPEHYRKGIETVTKTLCRYGGLPIKPPLAG